MRAVGFDAVLALHVAAGATALLAGPMAMLARKGRRAHRLSGRCYAAAMVVTAASALCLALATRNVLLLVIAVFSFFLVFTGWRAPGQKRLHEAGQGARWFDWLVAALTLAFSAGLFVRGSIAGGNVTELFFGAGGSILTLREMLQLTGCGVRDGDWLVRHMIGMSGAYIATVSAFAVVTLTALPRPVAFIGPTLIGTPLIVLVATRLTVALRQGRTAQEILREPAGRRSPAPIAPAPLDPQAGSRAFPPPPGGAATS